MSVTTEEIAAFSERATAFLDANAKRQAESRLSWGEGPDALPLLEGSAAERQQDEVAAARRWRRTLYDGGYGWLSGPAEFGGAEMPDVFDEIFFDLQKAYELPDMSYFGIATRMLGPTVYKHGSQDLKLRYLRSLYNGDLIACQLFSEPGAGSDLASVQARAERDGDGWVVSGQKVWNSFAHVAQVGELLVRTDPAAPKHRGLTMFVIDMSAPGVEVRPLRQMTGAYAFNEVFLDNVWVPDHDRIGELGEGWPAALTTLNSERGAIGEGATNPESLPVPRLLHIAAQLGAPPEIQDRLSRILCEEKTIALLNDAARERLAAGIAPGAEGSITKLRFSRNLEQIAAAVADVLGSSLVCDQGTWGTYAWADFVCSVPGMRIAGGTDEVLLNVIGERLLGLPREPRPAP